MYMGATPSCCYSITFCMYAPIPLLTHTFSAVLHLLVCLAVQGRGKTTLLSVLRDKGGSLPENISTVGVVVNKWECNLQLKGSNKKVRMV